MFRAIMNFFKAISIFLTGTVKVLEEGSKALENSAEQWAKSTEISLAETIEKSKKTKAQMVIDGGYESEEAMDKEHDEIIKKARARHK